MLLQWHEIKIQGVSLVWQVFQIPYVQEIRQAALPLGLAFQWNKRHFLFVNKLNKKDFLLHFQAAQKRRAELNQRKWHVNFGQYSFLLPVLKSIEHRKRYVEMERRSYNNRWGRIMLHKLQTDPQRPPQRPNHQSLPKSYAFLFRLNVLKRELSIN